MAKPNTKLPADIFVSVILLTDQRTEKLASEVQKVSQLLRSHYRNYEIVIIDNFLPVKEFGPVSELLDSVPCIRIIRLSRVVEKDTAAFSGLEAAIGDYVVLLIPGNDPVRLISSFVEKNQAADIVFGISKKPIRRGLLNKYGAELFYWYNKKYLNISIPARSTYFMAFNRRAVNALTRSGRYARHVRYLARQIGYKMKELHYSPSPSAHVEKKSPKALFTSALELTTSYSQHPLRFITWIGTAAASINLLYCGYVVGISIFKPHVAEGWISLSLQAAIMFLFVFLILAILSEYIGKILQQSSNEPPYHVMDELSSKVSVADTIRRNITH